MQEKQLWRGLNSLLIVVQVICAISIIVLILLAAWQEGADMGAAFGGGASGSLFGASGSANFLFALDPPCWQRSSFLATIGLAYTATTATHDIGSSRPAARIMSTVGKDDAAAPRRREHRRRPGGPARFPAQTGRVARET